MSLTIRTNRLVAVYALGQWHPVTLGSFFTDAYELAEGDPSPGEHCDFFQLGGLQPCPELPSIATRTPNPGSVGQHWRWCYPTPMTGCQWIDPKTKEQVSMPLASIQAWREAPAR